MRLSQGLPGESKLRFKIELPIDRRGDGILGLRRMWEIESALLLPCYHHD